MPQPIAEIGTVDAAVGTRRDAPNRHARGAMKAIAGLATLRELAAPIEVMPGTPGHDAVARYATRRATGRQTKPVVDLWIDHAGPGSAGHPKEFP